VSYSQAGAGRLSNAGTTAVLQMSYNRPTNVRQRKTKPAFPQNLCLAPCLTVLRRGKDPFSLPASLLALEKLAAKVRHAKSGFPLLDHLFELRLVLGRAAGARLRVDHMYRLGLAYALPGVGLHRLGG